MTPATNLNHEGPVAPTPGWWRLAACAPLTGLRPKLLVAGIERGEIPVRILRVGARGLVYLHAADLAAWMHGGARPAPDSCADLFGDTE